MWIICEQLPQFVFIDINIGTISLSANCLRQHQRFLLIKRPYYNSSLSDKTLRRQKESLESALMRSITYCYIEEGAYPESLDYLREHYPHLPDTDPQSAP